METSRSLSSTRNNSTNSLGVLATSNETESTINTSHSLFHVVNISSTSSMSSSSGNKLTKLIGLNQKSVFYLTGFCRITLLKGKLSINGYNLVYGKQTTIKNPVWMPACRAFASSSSPSNRNFDQLLQSHCVDSTDRYQTCTTVLADNNYVCVFLLEGISQEEQEWMVAAEDQSLFSYENVFKRLSIGRSREEIEQLSHGLASTQDCSLCSVQSAMIGSLDHMISLGLEIMNMPSSWVEGVDAIIKSINNSNRQTNEVGEKHIKSIICGAKGVGKSSCLRYSINSMLSQCKSVEAVCVIDCDIGQPELTVPGMISLQIVANPILQAVHYNMHRSVHTPTVPSSSAAGDRFKAIKDNIRMGKNQVIASYYLGDLSTKNDPELLFACLNKLMEEYTMIANEYEAVNNINEFDNNGATKITKKNSADKLNSKQSSNNNNNSGGSSGSYNNFNILMELEEESKNKKRKATSSSSGIVKSLPLLVNTDGFIRSMGAEILYNVLAIVKPSHILQFSTEKDIQISSVERYKEQLRQNSNNNNTENIDEEQSTATSHKNDKEDEVCGCIVKVLTAGRTSAAKVDAIDLRTLRLVSYFLGGCEDSVGIKNKVRGVNNTPTGIYIRNGTIVDLEGTLAVAVLRVHPLIVPFNSVALQSINGVSLNMLLAALNASIVGLVNITSGGECGVSTCKHIMKLKSNTTDVNGSGVECVIHSIPQTPGAKLFPCFGLAIVRCIDINKQYLAITTPITASNRVIEAMNLVNQTATVDPRYGVPETPSFTLAIVKGEASQQLPNCLLFAQGMPVYPYLSSESAGEGSAKMKARNNVKRRGQAK